MQLNKPSPVKISIIVPVYKAEPYLPRCIESILSQTFSEFELLLIDDGSPDNSGKICDKYAINDNRIRVFHKINGGVSSARNLGLDHVSGEFVMFVDSDDWIATDCLELCVNEIYGKYLDALQFGLAMVWDDKTTYMIKNATDVLSGDEYVRNNNFNVSAGGGIYRTDIIRSQNIRFEESVKYAEDQLFILSFFKNAKRIMYKDVALYYYYQNPESAIHTSKSKDMLLSCEKLIDLSKEWSTSKSFIDKMIVQFIIGMIKNNDVPYKILRDIYKSQNVGSFYTRNRLQDFFRKIAQINFYLACWLTFKYSHKKK